MKGYFMRTGLCLVLGACLLAGCGNPAEGLSFGGSVNGNTDFAAAGDKLAYARNLENGSVLELLDREKGAALQTEYGLYFPYYACDDAVLGRTADDAIGLFRLEDYKLSTVLRLPADMSLGDYVPLGQTVYYVAGRDGTDELRAYHMDTGKDTTFLIGEDISGLWAYDQSIFAYVQASDGAGQLYRFAAGDLEAEGTAEDNTLTEGVLVHETEGEWQLDNLFSTPAGLVAAETGGNGDGRAVWLQSGQIREQIQVQAAGGDALYYFVSTIEAGETVTDRQQVYRMPADGSGGEAVCTLPEPAAGMQVLEDGTLLIETAGGFYEAAANGTEVVRPLSPAA